MSRKIATIILGIAFFALERGLDVSGFENIKLAYALWSLSGFLLLVGIIWLLVSWFREKGPMSDSNPGQEQDMKDSPGAFQAQAGGSQSFGDVHVGDRYEVAKVQPVTATLDGYVDGNRIRLVVRHDSLESKVFKVRLHSATGGIEGHGAPIPNKWLGAWLQWDGSDSMRENVPPGPGSEVLFADAKGHGTWKVSDEDIRYRTIAFHGVGLTPQISRRLVAWIPFGGRMECEIEVQCETQMTAPIYQTWILKIDESGNPSQFMQRT